MRTTNCSKSKNKEIRLIVGLSKYNKSPLVTSMGNNYPFNTAAFVINNIGHCSVSELNSFRRVLGMIFSPTRAKTLIGCWKKNNTSGPQIALDLKNNFNIYLGNYSEKTNLTKFIKKNNATNLKILLLTVDSFEDPIFKNLDAEIFKYTHPSQRGNTQQLFEDFDYCSQGYGFSSADDIKQNFSIK